MGKTVESFRIALEGEVNRWSGCARALRKPDREVFDQLKDMCNQNGLARLRCGNNIAYAWQVQTRGADETSTQFQDLRAAITLLERVHKEDII